VPLLASCVQSCFHDICRIQNSDFSLKTLASANASLFKFKRGTRFSHIALVMVFRVFFVGITPDFFSPQLIVLATPSFFGPQEGMHADRVKQRQNCEI
jgi:hypothetical protein